MKVYQQQIRHGIRYLKIHKNKPLCKGVIEGVPEFQ